MTDRLLHWIGQDTGDAHRGAEEGFLWLDDEATGGHGSLWLVARGHGPEAAPPIAAGLVVHTFRDVYVDALDDGADPFGALDRAAAEAGRRLRAAATTYPDLRGLACSVAAVAVHDGQAWPVHIGAARIYAQSGDRLRRLTRDHVSADYAVHDEAAAGRLRRDDIVDRAIGHHGARLDRGTGHPLPAVDHAFLLCTDGLWRATSDEILHQALRRLPPRDAWDALVELARRQWFEDDLTIALVRDGLPAPEYLTTRDAFVRWAAGEAMHREGANATLVIQAPIGGRDERPPVSIAPARLPDLDAARHNAPPPPVRDAEPSHTVVLTPRPPVGSEPSREAAAPRSAGGTQLLSRDAIAAAPASASRTQAFSPQELDRIRGGRTDEETTRTTARSGGSPSVVVSDEASLAASTGEGTQIFAPADLASPPPDARRGLQPAPRPRDAAAPVATPRGEATQDEPAMPERKRGGNATVLAPAHQSGPVPAQARARRPAPQRTPEPPTRQRDPFAERWDRREDDDAWLDDSGLHEVLTPGRKVARTLLWLVIALLSAGGGFAATLWFINR